MNIWDHSRISVRKFGGQELDYFNIHKFIDSSKLFYFHVKHRLLLHNHFGIELCVKKFGDIIINSENKEILTRDIAAEHCKEDLDGKVPSLYDWLKVVDVELSLGVEILEIEDTLIHEFVYMPYLKSGLKSSLIITYSNFGAYLIKEILGFKKAYQFCEILTPKNNIGRFLNNYRFTEKWQFTPSPGEIAWLKQENNKE